MKLTPLQKRAARNARHGNGLDMNLVSLIDVFTILIFFLLSSSGVETLPGKTNGVEQLKVNDLKLEVVVRHDAIEVGDKIGGLIQRIPNTADGVDATALNTLMFQIKRKFPDTSAASVLPEPNTPYQTVIHVMDAMRTGKTANGGTTVVDVDLFPAISIGDAPVRH